MYAPVLIPTVSRSEHFINCIESLKKNPLAIETTLYIALDFPAKMEHKLGYSKICSYLVSLTGFKSIVIIKRSVNYGADMNASDATKEVLKKHDAIIFSEDDNIFSLNFLEFINKGLEIFKNDKSVLAINGYRHFYNIKYEKNNYYRQGFSFSAWGYGIWKDRIEEYEKRIKQSYFLAAFINPVKLYRVWKNGSYGLYNFIRYAFIGCNEIHDNVLSLFMIIEKKTVIMPVCSKVRNMGWDGSGINDASQKYPTIAEKHLYQIIDEDKTFTYIGKGWEYFKENQKIYKDEAVWKKNIPYLILEYLYRKAIKRWLHFAENRSSRN
jgi:hypothetical protein